MLAKNPLRQNKDKKNTAALIKLSRDSGVHYKTFSELLHYSQISLDKVNFTLKEIPVKKAEYLFLIF